MGTNNTNVIIDIEGHKYEVAPCNCGGPAMGTDHSPDCQFVLDSEECWDEHFCREAEECEFCGAPQWLPNDNPCDRCYCR
jgi:hypothetical protein